MELILLVINVILTGILALSMFGLLCASIKLGKSQKIDKDLNDDGHKLSN